MLAAGETLPEHLAEGPELALDLVLFYNAFTTLDNCRVSGFDVGRIPWDAIDRYCVKHDITGDMEDDMHYFLGCLDDAYREHIEKKKPKKET